MCVLMCVIASVGLRGWVGGGKELKNRKAFLMGSLFSLQQSTALEEFHPLHYVLVYFSLFIQVLQVHFFLHMWKKIQKVLSHERQIAATDTIK